MTLTLLEYLFTDCKKILECSLELHDKYTKSNSDPCNDLQVDIHYGLT